MPKFQITALEGPKRQAAERTEQPARLPRSPQVPVHQIGGSPWFKRNLAENMRVSAIVPERDPSLKNTSSERLWEAEAVLKEHALQESLLSKYVEEKDSLVLGEAYHSETAKHVFFVVHAEGLHQAPMPGAQRSQAAEACRRLNNGDDEKHWVENWAMHWANPKAAGLDAELSEEGRYRCEECCKAAEDLAVELVVVSPFRRTLETAQLLFSKADAEPSFIVHDLCRERFGELTCNKRNSLAANKAWKPRHCPRSFLAKYWDTWDWSTQESYPISLSRKPLGLEHSNLDTAWQQQRESKDQATKRATLFLDWLLERKESRIAVVTHPEFIFLLKEALQTDSE